MDIIPGLISEDDVKYMPDSLLEAFSLVFDDILARRFKAYIENPAADKSTVNRIVSVIGDSIQSHTFHEVVIANGTKDIISNLPLEMLAYEPRDYDLLERTLVWTKENRKFMQATIDPRTRTNYMILEKEATAYDRLCYQNGYPVVYDHMCDRIKANKKLFYSPTEKQKGTRISAVIRRVQDCDIAYLGVQYLKYCQQHEITGWRASEF